MSQYIDQLGRPVDIPSPAKRIISLVPSITELLADLGLDNETVGITKFCVHPNSWFYSKSRVGGTKAFHIDQIQQLHPDLIIANKEENVQEQIEELAKHYPVWISDISNLEDALQMIEKIGEITGKPAQSIKMSEDIRRRFHEIPNKNIVQKKAAYLIWQKPYMTIGNDTFIHDMMQYCGFQNVFGNKTRYPETSIEEIKSLNVDILLLSSEPFPFKQKHIEELQPYLPQTKIILADGEMFSWYGSRLLLAPEYFKKIISGIY